MEPQVEAVRRGSGQGIATGRSSLMKGLEETSGLGVPEPQAELGEQCVQVSRAAGAQVWRWDRAQHSQGRLETFAAWMCRQRPCHHKKAHGACV